MIILRNSKHNFNARSQILHRLKLPPICSQLDKKGIVNLLNIPLLQLGGRFDDLSCAQIFVMHENVIYMKIQNKNCNNTEH